MLSGWRKISRISIFGLGLLLLGCSEDKPPGTIYVELIQPVKGQHCEYTISSGEVQTLQSLLKLRGSLGSVMTSEEEVRSRESILDTMDGLRPVYTQFSKAGSTYFPLDYESLFGISLYYAIETGHRLFKGLDESAGNMLNLIPDFAAKTTIIHEAIRSKTKSNGDIYDVTDNAAYLPHSVEGEGGSEILLNYFFSYPSEDVTEIPLGLNLGIMVHEYSHLVMHHLFWEPGIQRDMKLRNNSDYRTKFTLAALDEGLADYFGFLATMDPGFFLCSYPEEDRNLDNPSKTFSEKVVEKIAGVDDYSGHAGGAIFAAINYEIGHAIGSHDRNGRSLVKLMASLLTCSDVLIGGDTLAMNFGAVSRCHLKVMDSRDRSKAQEVYQRRLGVYK